MHQFSLVRLACVLCLTTIALSASWTVPSSADKSFALAVQDTKLGNDQKATGEFQQFLSMYPSDERASQAGYLLGSLYQKQQAYAKALTAYSQVLVKASGLNFTALRADTHYQMGECYRATQNYEKAIQSYGNCLQLNAKVAPTDTTIKFISDRADLAMRAQYWMAESLYQAKQEDEALRAYEAVLASAPKHEYAAWALYSMGIIELHQSNFNDAINNLERLATDYSSFTAQGDEKFYLGMAYAGQSAIEMDSIAKDAFFQKAITVWKALLGTANIPITTKQQTAKALADVYLNHGDTDNTVVTYKTILGQSDPASRFAVETHLQLGHVLYNAKRFAEARDEYAIVSQNKPYADLAVEGSFWLGNSRYQLALASKDNQMYRDTIAALTTFETPSAEKNDKAASAMLIMAYCYEDLVDLGEKDAHEKALAAYTKILKQWPSSEQAAQARNGIARLTQSMTAEQLRVLTGTLPTGTTSWNISLQLATKEFEAGRYDNAITAARQVLNGKPTNDVAAQAAYLIGISLQKLGRAREAASYFQQVITVTPTGDLMPHARRALVQAYLAAKNYVDACSAATAYLTLPLQGANEQAERLIFLAIAYQGNSRQDDALATYRKVVTQFPSSSFAPYALMNIAALVEAKGDAKTAIATYQEFIAKFPDDERVADAFYQLGIDLAKLKDYSGAINAFRNVPNTSKYADQAAYAIAWAYVDQQLTDQANAQFELVTQKFPSSPLVADCWFRLGEAKMAQKDYAGAMRAYNRALELAKDEQLSALIAYQLGVSAYLAKEYTIAANAFGKIAANHPSSQYAAESIFWRASSLEYQGAAQANAARDGYLQYLAKSPDGEYATDASLGIGRVAVATKQYTAARTGLQKTLDLCAKLEKSAKADRLARIKGIEVEAQFYIGQSYLEEKDYASALREFAVLSMFNYEPWCSRARLQVARCYASQGDKPSARKILRDLIASAPNSDGAKQAQDLAKELSIQL